MTANAPDTPYRGRFAPSPTGPLHFGSLIAALGSFLDARQAGGAWLLRMEDLDTPRVVAGAADDILRTLERFGLHWDGPVLYQSRNGHRYQAALDRLQAQGRIYPCTCSRREIARVARLGPCGLVYPGTCRRRPSHPQRPPALRLFTEADNIGFTDAVQGPLHQNLAHQVGDFVLRRADGLFAYQLAVVVDDADQGITRVVRGCDLMDSTPRQIGLQQLLALPTPGHAHLPVAVDPQGYKLSKQTGARPLDPRRPAPALIQALDFLGQCPPPELLTAAPDTILAWALEHWRLERVPARSSRLCSPPIAAESHL